MTPFCPICDNEPVEMVCCDYHQAWVCWGCYWHYASQAEFAGKVETICGLNLPETPFDLEEASRKLRQMIAELEAA